jgi:hypothetical protein
MIALEVLINGVRQFLAGVEDWDLIHANILARRAASDDQKTDLYTINISGLPTQTQKGVLEHIRWGEKEVSLGDEITLRFVSVDSADAPIKRFRSDHEVQENPFTEEELLAFEKEDYLRLKAKFEASSV